MKYIKIVLKVLLFVFLISIIISFIVKNIVVDTFSQEILSKKVSGYLLDEIVYDVDINELGAIENNIRKSKITKNITSKFINTIIQNIINNEKTKLDVENEVDMLISEYMPNEISKEKLQDIKDNGMKQIINTQERLQDNLLYSFGDGYTIILKMYNIFTNVYFIIIISILSLVDMAILFLLEKHSLLKSIKNISLIITILMLVLLVIIKLLANFIDQRLAGGWLQQINVNVLIVSIIIGSILSILLVLIDRNVNFEVKEEK